MKKDEQRESEAVNGGVALWLYFEEEARVDAREQHRPPRLRFPLKAGDRVSFDLGDGVDGPSYATNVHVIEPD
jgi:hypothetical protein